MVVDYAFENCDNHMHKLQAESRLVQGNLGPHQYTTPTITRSNSVFYNFISGSRFGSEQHQSRPPTYEKRLEYM